MKAFLALILLLAAMVVGLGFYRGWWSFESDTTGTKVHLNVTVDKDVIQEDRKAAAEKMQDLGRQATGKSPAERIKAEEAPPTQPPEEQP